MFGDSDNCGFGSDVNGSASAVIARHGCDVDDGRAFAHFFERRADTLHGSHFVDGNNFFRVLVEVFVYRFESRVQHARIIDENVDFSELVRGGLHQSFAVPVLGNVRGDGQDAAAFCADFFRHFIERGLSSGADDDVRSFPSKQQRRSRAHSRIAARNDGRFAL